MSHSLVLTVRQAFFLRSKEGVQGVCLIFIIVSTSVSCSFLSGPVLSDHVSFFWLFVSQASRNHWILLPCCLIHLTNALLLLFSWLYLLHSSKSYIFSCPLDNPVFETCVIAYTFDLWVYVWLHVHALSSSQKKIPFYTIHIPCRNWHAASVEHF